MSAAGTPAAVGASHTGIIGPRTAARQAGVARTHSDAITSGGPATKRDRLHLCSEESRNARSPTLSLLIAVAERPCVGHRTSGSAHTVGALRPSCMTGRFSYPGGNE